MNHRERFCVAPTWSTLRVVGPDASTWLNGIVTCDVTGVRPGHGVWGTLLTKQGKIAAELQIVGRPDDLFVGISGGNAEEILRVLDGYVVMEDCEIEASSLKWLLFIDPERPDEEGTANELRGRLHWGSRQISYILAGSEQSSSFRTNFGEELLSPEEWRKWLTDAGIPQFGLDYDSGDNLHAASLERRTVDWSKGCYLGQEVVCMQDMRGKVRRRLVALKPSDASILKPGADLKNDEGETVGQITSVGHHRAIGMVRGPEFADNTRLHFDAVELLVGPVV